METTAGVTWSPADYCLRTPATDADLAAAALAPEVYRKACRLDLSSPGFCLIDLGPDGNSERLRALLVALFAELSRQHVDRTGTDLVCLSAARFDQQVTTRLHLDGAPDESLLVLGYEASTVRSQVTLADHSRCASDLGITPAELLRDHNPMFRRGEALLQPYATSVASRTSAIRRSSSTTANRPSAPVGKAYCIPPRYTIPTNPRGGW